MKLPTVEINLNLCKGCGLCVENCPPKALFISAQFNVLGYQYAQYQGNGCTGCEACFYTCPEPSAMTVVKALREKPKAQGSDK
ncbi:4Fe-4S dicluster domain-containing protein [Bdellovibrionota bacterium FG-1]